MIGRSDSRKEKGLNKLLAFTVLLASQNKEYTHSPCVNL